MNEEKGQGKIKKKQRENYFFFRFKNTSHMTNFLFSLSSTYPHISGLPFI